MKQTDQIGKKGSGMVRGLLQQIVSPVKAKNTLVHVTFSRAGIALCVEWTAKMDSGI